MSRDWILLVLLALGHAAILVYLINVLHSLGCVDRGRAWLKLVAVAAALVMTLGAAHEVSRGGWAAWSWPLRAYAALCLTVIVAGVPIATWRLRFRVEPEGIAEQSEEISLLPPEGAGALIGRGSHAWLLKLRGNESFRLRKREWQVGLPGLPAAWDGLSVVHVTDLHFSPCFERAYFERVADEAAAWDADLVVFTGDLVDHDDAIDWIVPVMSRLRGRLGSLAILGNHDYAHHPHCIRRALETAGFTDLDGHWHRIAIDGKVLAVGGTSAPWGPNVALDAYADADLRILLSHTPDLFYRAAGAEIDLMLSGHNHGGQIRLPVLGPVFMPSRYSRRFDRGWFRAGRTRLHVSQGVAGKHPIRIGCVPEIGRITLRALRLHGADQSVPRNRVFEIPR